MFKTSAPDSFNTVFSRCHETGCEPVPNWIFLHSRFNKFSGLSLLEIFFLTFNSELWSSHKWLSQKLSCCDSQTCLHWRFYAAFWWNDVAISSHFYGWLGKLHSFVSKYRRVRFNWSSYAFSNQQFRPSYARANKPLDIFLNMNVIWSYFT